MVPTLPWDAPSKRETVATFVIRVLRFFTPVLYQVDELGTGDVPWADKTIVAPTLLKLGEEGLRLGTQYAWQWCAPTRGSLLSGRFPMHTGYTGGGMPGDGQGLELKWPLLPAELKTAGCTLA